jgi:hypothetical protein
MREITNSRKLIQILQQTLLKQRLVLSAAGLLLTLTVVLAAWIILSLLANVVILPVAVKVSLLILSGLVTLYFFGRHAIGRFFSGTVDDVAVDLETRNPALKGRLIAAIQFSRTAKTPGYSSELIDMTEKQALKEAGGINFNESVRFYPVLRTGRLLGGCVVVAVALLLLVPGLFTYSYEVYSNPTSVIAPPLGYKLVANPGSTEWIKYRDIPIGASIFGDHLPDKASVSYRMAGGSWQKAEIDLRKQHKFELAGGDSVAFAITLRQVNKSFDYYVEAGREKTEIQKVDVVDRPRVQGIKLSVFYPDYTGLQPTVVDENNGSFSAVVGSRVNMKITTNLPITQAELVFDDSSRTPMKVLNKEAEIAMVVDKSRSYHIRLTDRMGENNPDPIEYYVTAVPDDYPSIDVVRPGFDVNLTDDMTLPLKVHIFDDYGFSSLVMKYRVVSQGRPSEENVAVLHYPDKIKTEGEVEFNWDMDKLNMYPGDYVTYYFEVADNDRISGPKITKSHQFMARLPSLDEIVAQTQSEGNKRIIKTEDMLRASKELSKRLNDVSRKLQAQGTTPQPQENWEQQKELQSIVDKNAQLLDQIDKSSQEMNKSVDKMNQQALMSQDILDKLAEIQKLFEEVATPEMKEAQKKLAEAMKKMNPKDLQDAIKNFQLSQQELVDRLDRTLALLKKMQLQQQMEAMVRQIEQLAKRQEQMNQTTDSSAKSALPNLSEQESKLQSKLEDLKKQVSDLDKTAQDAKMDQSPEYNKFKEALEKTDANQDMQQMSQSLSQSQKSQASKQGKNAHTKIMSMLDTMQQQLLAMKSDEDDAAKKQMRMALDDSNYLSRSQEDMYNQAAAVNAQSMLLHDFAKNQLNLTTACQGLKARIDELGKMSPFLASELSQIVTSATDKMDLATKAFDANQASAALRNQRDAMVGLNEASVRLMESLEQQSQCDKGGSCDKNTSNLQSLCERQNNLNQKTQSECNKPGQNPKMGEGDAERQNLQRLAGEQGAIRKSLEELNKEFGGSRQILGRLDDIAKEMKEIQEAMANGEVGQDVLNRQIKVYSRMLEATRSLYRKDFSQQRQATTATSDAFVLPPELSPDVMNDRSSLEDRLRQYLGDSYPPQYEEQIKAYFKALLQASGSATQGQDNNTTPSE